MLLLDMKMNEQDIKYSAVVYTWHSKKYAFDSV